MVLTNAQASNAFNGAITRRLFELVFEQAPETAQMVTFALAQTERAVAELQERILENVDPEVVTPYLGRYTNEALGELSLTLEEGRLIADAGEFRTELRPTVDTQGDADGYVSFDAPFAGLPLELEGDEAGNPIIRFGEGAVTYTLTLRKGFK